MTDYTTALPEIGEGAHLAFDTAAMEALHKRFKDNYVADMLNGLDRNDVSVFKAALEAMSRGTEASAADIIDKFTLTELAIRIADTVSLRVHGKKFKEQQADRIAAAVDADAARAATDGH